MINNPWVNRVAVLTMMFMIYAAGYDSGKNQTAFASQQAGPCKTVVKP